MSESIVILVAILMVSLGMTLSGSAQVTEREHYVHFATFDNTLDGLLNNNVMGYQYALGDEQGILFGDFGGLTRTGMDHPNGPQNWDNGSQMMSASIAKMITTVAILDMLENTSIAGALTMQDKLNLLLKDYLPVRWRNLIDGTEGQIRLIDLLRHQSGYPVASSIDPVSALNTTVNVAIPDAYEYANINFNLAGFMAIYMAFPIEMQNWENALVASGDELYNASFTAIIRNLHYQYIQDFILLPSGIIAECGAYVSDPSLTEVLRYGVPPDSVGTDFGTIQTCMSNGWILSAYDMIRFMQNWANPDEPGNILTFESVSLINDFPNNATTTPLGWIWDRDTDLSEGYGHNGILNSGANDTYTSGIVLTQDNFYMAVNVNSRATGGNITARGADLVTAYNAAVCAEDITLTGSFAKKFNSASDQLTTFGNVEVELGKRMVFKAGNKITMLPGFHAKVGSQFRAYLDVCSNPPALDE